MSEESPVGGVVLSAGSWPRRAAGRACATYVCHDLEELQVRGCAARGGEIEEDLHDPALLGAGQRHPLMGLLPIGHVDKTRPEPGRDGATRR